MKAFFPKNNLAYVYQVFLSVVSYSAKKKTFSLYSSIQLLYFCKADFQVPTKYEYFYIENLCSESFFCFHIASFRIIPEEVPVELIKGGRKKIQLKVWSGLIA